MSAWSQRVGVVSNNIGPHLCHACGEITTQVSVCLTCSDLMSTIFDSTYWQALHADWLKEQDYKRKLLEGKL